MNVLGKIIAAVAIAIIVLCNEQSCLAQQFLKHRDKQQLSQWQFHKGEAALDSLADVEMTEVTIPHTWNNEDVFSGPKSYNGAAWYQTVVKLEKPADPKRYFLRFEGVQTVADIYINKKYVGTHKGGYSAFCFEITQFISLGEENAIAVRVDNSFRRDVAPAGPALYPLFGGIYRPVTLFSTGQVCVSPLDYASAGVYIAQKKVSAAKAELEIKTLISHGSDTLKNIIVSASFKDREGNIVGQISSPVGDSSEIIQTLVVDNPHLWQGKKDPYLYTATIELKDEQGNSLDVVEQDIGLRFFEVNAKTGLALNGKPFDLYGVCRHQEWKGVGTALADEHHQRDIDLILELGATGVRLAHYQQADTVYRLCDEKGLIIWAEIPVDPPYIYDNSSYLENCEQQLIELIKQNYNHGSIFFWGLYNEVEIPPADLSRLNAAAKKLDSTRLTTQADFREYSQRHTVTDIVGWNRYNGWYNANLHGTIEWLEKLHQTNPDLIVGISEYGADGCITQQQENPERPDPLKGRFFPEQYQRLYHEVIWGDIKNRKDLWCKFVWCMFDFSWTTVVRGDEPYKNHKGLMTQDRKVKKDAFYFYKANWSDEPVLYIASRRNIERKEELTSVVVYTNLAEVELLVNGTVISKKAMASDIHKIEWQQVKLQRGRNYISVIGRRDGKTFTDACEWLYQ